MGSVLLVYSLLTKPRFFAIYVQWGITQGLLLNKEGTKKFLKVFTMKTQKKNNFVRINIRTLIFIVSVLFVATTQAETTNLLYILADISANPAIILEYSIGDKGRLHEKHQYEIPYYGIGAVGLAIDSDSQHLFVTYEDSAVIQILDATTMASKGTFTVQGPDSENLAGIVYDHDNQLLYCVRRRQETLFVFYWDPATATLTPVADSPFSLKGATAYGIALDEVNDLLYVANHTRTIRMYNTSDWSEAGTIELDRHVVSVAVDEANEFIYAGGGYLGNRYLTQYDLTAASNNERDVEIKEGGALGICVDQTTGYVYVGTGYDGKKGGDDLLVYDLSLNCIEQERDIGNPTGLVISCPRRNHFHLTKEVVSGIVAELHGYKYVHPGGTVTYNISFNSDNLDYTAKNVSIVDKLSKDVDFVTADEDGVSGKYDKDNHEYTWNYSSVPPGFSASLNLVVQVKENIPAGRKITNDVIINSSDTLQTTANNNVYTRAIDYLPIDITVDIIGGIPVDGKCVAAGENITYRICFDNNNEYKVNNVSIIDTLPRNVSFVSADGDGSLGHYDSKRHTCEWFYESLGPKSHSCLELQVCVDPNTPPLTSIENLVAIISDETRKETATVSIETCKSAPIEADMCIIPKVIGPRTISDLVLTIVVLPEGIDPNDVEDDMMPILYINDIDAIKIEAVDQRTDPEICPPGTSIVAAFNKKDILDAATNCGYGEANFKVVGQLKSGETFYAETTAYLTEVGPFIWRWLTSCCP
jgi:uncharacterized repeat protein (TIGR01451 family)